MTAPTDHCGACGHGPIASGAPTCPACRARQWTLPRPTEPFDVEPHPRPDEPPVPVPLYGIPDTAMRMPRGPDPGDYRSFPTVMALVLAVCGAVVVTVICVVLAAVTASPAAP